MKCMVRDTVGEDAITLDDGESIHDQIQPELAAGREVELDFDGVSVFAAPFFNAAIGELFRDLKPDDVNRLLRVQHLNGTGADVLGRVIENAKKYYASADYRAAQAKILQRMSEAD